MRKDSIFPIFIFSLPRSGSTLAQRTLAAHEAVSTTSEPWLLLPYVYATRAKGVYAEYTHEGAAGAIEDFSRALPGGTEDYVAELREFVLRLYARAADDNAQYFLDKTPRYDLIAEEVISLFPQGKFIFLWRNPLSVVASNMETWSGGKWRLYTQKIDYFDGLASLVAAYERHQDRACAVRYEDLLLDPEQEWRRVFEYLNLKFDPDLLTTFTEVKLTGRMSGDPTGSTQYQSVAREPLEKWKQTLTNPLRKAWCRRYVNWIGAERLGTMGYDMEHLLTELNNIPTTSRLLLSDTLRLGYGLFYQWMEPTLLKDKLKLLPHIWRIHVHR